MKPRSEVRARLGGFAVSHFLISIVGFVPVIPFFALDLNYDLGLWLLVVLCAVLLAAYVPMGMRKARQKQWSRPRTLREGLRYFLAPAAIAWGWGALVAVTLMAGMWRVLLAEFYATVLLASPAVWQFFLITVLDVRVESWLWLAGFVLLAGGLPPLLFTFGSVWGSRKEIEGMG